MHWHITLYATNALAVAHVIVTSDWREAGHYYGRNESVYECTDLRCGPDRIR